MASQRLVRSSSRPMTIDLAPAAPCSGAEPVRPGSPPLRGAAGAQATRTSRAPRSAALEPSFIQPPRGGLDLEDVAVRICDVRIGITAMVAALDHTATGGH